MCKSPSLYLVFILSIIVGIANSAPSKHSSRSEQCPIKLPQDQPFSNDTGEPTNSSLPRIVNGDIISTNLLRYMVVTVPFICTGALISPNWFVTAAHCRLDSRFRVALGVPIASGYNESNTRNIVRSFDHPGFQDIVTSGGYDFAVHEISPAAPVESKFLRVAINPVVPLPNTFARVMGYGDTEDFEDGGGIGRQVDVPVTTDGYCKKVYTHIDSERQFCAGYEEGGCDSCQGDSGGPIIQYDYDEQPVLVGVVSAGAGCANRNSPGIYTRASVFESFLDEIGVNYTKTVETQAVDARQKRRVSTGAMVGIGIGVAIAVCVVVGIAVWYLLRKFRKRSGKEQVVGDAPSGNAES